jgi:hypothetical protein
MTMLLVTPVDFPAHLVVRRHASKRGSAQDMPSTTATPTAVSASVVTETAKKGVVEAPPATQAPPSQATAPPASSSKDTPAVSVPPRPTAVPRATKTDSMNATSTKQVPPATNATTSAQAAPIPVPRRPTVASKQEVTKTAQPEPKSAHHDDDTDSTDDEDKPPPVRLIGIGSEELQAMLKPTPASRPVPAPRK